MLNTIPQKPQSAVAIYGNDVELREMAHRYKTALPNGMTLRDGEALALAQVAKITGLNPFVKEIWYIPGVGPTVGIAGARRLWNEKSTANGGWSNIVLTPCDPIEAGATDEEIKTKIIVAAFRAEAHDSKANAEYQKMFVETIKIMRESGSTDPFKDAKEVCGAKPVWYGWGYSTLPEKSRMNKVQLARKRAEADVLKKCIVIPFGASISTEREYASEDVIDATAMATTEEPSMTPLEELIALYGAERVMAAAGGIPQTPEEIEATRTKLENE